MRRNVGRWTASLVCGLLAAVLVVGSPASAHSALISSNPASGSTIDRVPQQVELRFNAGVTRVGGAIILRRGETTVAELTPVVEDAVVRADAPQDLSDGRYELVWRFVSVDGHPIDGVIPFTLGGDVAPPTEAPEHREPAEAAGRTLAIVIGVAAPVLLVIGVAITTLRRRRQGAIPRR